MHFVTYLFHYVIARTVYDGFRHAGVGAELLLAVAIVGLLVLRIRRR